MTKLERLLNLMAALLETERPLRAEELRSRVGGYAESGESFRRTFERDKDDLREMGVPLSVEPVPGTDPPVDGYRVHKDDYRLPDPGLDADELAALHLAATAVRLDGFEEAEALRKLGGSVGGAGAETIVSVPSDPRLGVIFDAVSARRVLSFDYKAERREVEPRRLELVRGRWYLTGFDRGRADERHFRVDRIDGDVTAGADAAFERVAGATGVSMQAWQLGDEPPLQARVRVDADQAAWAVHTVGPAVAEHSDGSVELEFRVTNRVGFLSFVCGFLDHAEVLDPPDLREDMIRWLTAIAEPVAEP